MSNESKCPFNHAAGGGTKNEDWWPDHLKVELLHQHLEIFRVGRFYGDFFSIQSQKLDAEGM